MNDLKVRQALIADMRRRTEALIGDAGRFGDDFLQYLYRMARDCLDEKAASERRCGDEARD